MQFCALEFLWHFFLATKTPKHEISQKIKHQNQSIMKKYEPIPEELEVIAKKIVNCAYKVHKAIGPGLLEKVYEVCFCHELSKAGLRFQRQMDIPIVYDGLEFEEGLRLDVLVEDKVVCELKALETVNPVWSAQILSHFKLTNKRLGFLINFNVVNIGNGISRFVKEASYVHNAVAYE